MLRVQESVAKQWVWNTGRGLHLLAKTPAKPVSTHQALHACVCTTIKALHIAAAVVLLCTQSAMAQVPDCSKVEDPPERYNVGIDPDMRVVFAGAHVLNPLVGIAYGPGALGCGFYLKSNDTVYILDTLRDRPEILRRVLIHESAYRNSDWRH